MTKKILPGGLAELRAWYVNGFTPKLAAAVAAGKVGPEAAAALDRRLREVLQLVGDAPVEEAA